MKEAAFILKVSPRTVAYHKYVMMEHLSIKSSAKLIEYAMMNSLTRASRRLSPTLLKEGRLSGQGAEEMEHVGLTSVELLNEQSNHSLVLSGPLQKIDSERTQRGAGSLGCSYV
jgi:hypothetical protein